MEEMSAEEISSILESELSVEDKSSILASYDWSEDNKLFTSSPMKKVEAKIEKDDGHKLNDVEKPKRNDESLLHPSSQQTKAKAKAKEIVDPLTDAEISLILYSELTLEEKSSLLTSNLIEDQIKIGLTPSSVELKEKVQRSEMKPKEDNDNLPSDGTSKGTNESLSQEKNQHMRTKASPEHDPITRQENGSVNRIDKASALRAQQSPAEDCHLLVELQEHIVFIARENKEPQNSSEGENVEKIYKEEAVCKKCCKYLFNEENVLKAKCKCKLALIHAHCAIQWAQEKGSICLSCGEQINNIPVTLTMDTSTSFPQNNNIAEELEEPTSVSKNWFWNCF